MKTKPIKFKFCLYVAGDTQNSVKALDNLEKLGRLYLPNQHDIEIVDVLQEPTRALADGIFMTPVLVKLHPLPVKKIVGTLTQTNTVLRAIGLDPS